jgi:hypothetical protein
MLCYFDGLVTDCVMHNFVQDPVEIAHHSSGEGGGGGGGSSSS